MQYKSLSDLKRSSRGDTQRLSSQFKWPTSGVKNQVTSQIGKEKRYWAGEQKTDFESPTKPILHCFVKNHKPLQKLQERFLGLLKKCRRLRWRQRREGLQTWRAEQKVGSMSRKNILI